MNFRQKVGKNGEQLSEAYLKLIGYDIIEKNFQSRCGEIDIIAKDKNELIFIEIKARNNKAYGLPSEAVTKKKIKHIYKTAEYYLSIKKLANIDIRIDAIELYIQHNKCVINHLKQII